MPKHPVTGSPPAKPGRKLEACLGRWVLQARWSVIVISLVLVALSASGARHLVYAPDYRLYFDEDDPQRIALETLEATYTQGDNILFVVVPDDGDAVSAQALEAAAWLTEQAWRTPFTVRVDSLTNFQHTTAEGDDLLVRDLVDETVWTDPAERARVRAVALAEPRLAARLIAADGEVSAVNVTVQLPGEDENLEADTVVNFAHGLAAAVRERFAGIDVRIGGLVAMNHAFTVESQSDMQVLLPASFGVMLLMLVAMTRSVSVTVGISLVILMSTAAAVGFAGSLRLPLTPPLASAPIIVLTVAVANCVHIVTAILQGVRSGQDKRDAIVEAVRINLQPVFIASLTTSLGFLSMNFSEVPPFRHVGTFVAFGVGVAFLLSITFLPALVSVLPLRAPAKPERSGRDLVGAVMDGLGGFVVRRRRSLIWGSVLVVAALAASIPRNELNDVFLHYLDEKVEFRRDADFIIENLTGLQTIEYSLASGEEGGIANPVFLNEVEAFAEWYRQQPETVHVDVITDTFRQLNRTLHGDAPSQYRLPESRDLAAQYLLLYEFSLPQGLDLNDRIDIDKSASRMTVTTKTLSSKEVLALNRRSAEWLAGNTPNISVPGGTGSTLMFAYLGQRNALAMFLGTALALVGISFILVFALRSLRLGLTSLVPNLVPAAMGFGIWGLFDGQVGVNLSVVTTITLGIVVDDTVHFLSKYLRGRRELGHAPPEAVRYVFRTAARPLFTTSVVLGTGFAILSLSSFEINSGLGQMCALIIALALLADFLFLPPLLMAIDRSKQ